MTIANLGDADIYWSPTQRRMLARKVGVTKIHMLPPDDVLIGAYAQPFSACYFVDLEDLLVQLEAKARGTSAAPPGTALLASA